MKDSETIKNSLIITIGTGLSKILGFLREVVIAAYFGATYLVDAYLAALVIPLMLFTVVNQALTTTVVPLSIEYEEKDGSSSVLRMLNSITSFLAILLAILIIIGEFLSGFLVHLVAPGFSVMTTDITNNLFKILMPIMLFMGLAGIGTGILQSRKRFAYPAFIGIPYNIFIIIAVLMFGRHFGVTALAVGTLVGVIAQWLFQIPDLRKNGFKYHMGIDFTHPGFKQMGKLILPVIIGSGAAQLNVLVDRMMASGLVEGSISALNYANRLSMLVYGIIAIAIANAVYPEMAEAVTLEQKDKLLNNMVVSHNSLLILIMPITIGMIILREPLVRIVFERGAFDATATGLTVIALLFFTIGLPAICLREITMRVFYSLQDTITPMYIGIGTVIMNIALIFVLIKPLALGGLALATSISVTIGYLAMLWLLHAKLGQIQGKRIISTGLKIAFASGIMGIFVHLLYRWMIPIVPNGFKGNFYIIMVNVVIGMIIYSVVLKAFHITEVEWLISRFRSKFLRKDLA